MMSKIILSSMLLLLVCAGLSFADDNLERELDQEMEVQTTEAMQISGTGDAPAIAPDGPIPCGESSAIKDLNESDSLKPACFEITSDGGVNFNKASQRMEKFEQKSSIVKVICKGDRDPNEKKTYLFILNKNKISKVVAGSQLAVHMNYNNGQCFDVTKVKQVLQPVPTTRSPANESK